MVYDGQEYDISADCWVSLSGSKSPPRKRYVTSGAASEPGLGEVAVSDAYGRTRDEAVTNFDNNVIAGVLIELMYWPN